MLPDTQPYEPAALVDTLRFRLSASVSVPRRDVRITAVVYALVSATDHDRDALESRVREALDRFIPAEWTVVSTKRIQDSTGYERVELSTSARVPIDEDHNLEERARRASREGLTIDAPACDYTLPTKTVVEQTAVLQERILELAVERAERFSRVEGRNWRIGDVHFGITHDAGVYMGKGTRRESSVESSAGELLVMSERLVLLAEVTLKTETPGGSAYGLPNRVARAVTDASRVV